MSDLQMGMMVIIAALAGLGMVVVYAIHRDHSANVHTRWGKVVTSPNGKRTSRKGKPTAKRKPKDANGEQPKPGEGDSSK
ncbi:MAG: hypothetical protein J0I06_11860 [Planctomycetes bacterium]|nr:hypothetical protein [Planctomycetota bacterium]